MPAAVALKHRMQVHGSRDIEPTDTDNRDDDHGEMPFAIDIVSGRSFGWSGDQGPGRQRMLEERAGMRSTSRRGRSLFRALGVYGRLALKTDLKSGLFIVARPGKTVAPCRISSRTYVGEERDGVSFGVGAPKDHAANLRRAVKPRGGELKNGERRTAGLRACHEGRPDPIQVRFDHSQPLETWNSAVRLSRRVLQGPTPTRRSAPPNTGRRRRTLECVTVAVKSPPPYERFVLLRRMALTFETACGAYQPPSLCGGDALGEATSWFPL